MGEGEGEGEGDWVWFGFEALRGWFTSNWDWNWVWNGWSFVVHYFIFIYMTLGLVGMKTGEVIMSSFL